MSGDSIIHEDNMDAAVSSDEENGEAASGRQDQMNKLIYNDSDDDDNFMRENSNKNVSTSPQGEYEDYTEINTEDIQSKLNELLDSDDSIDEENDSLKKNQKKIKRVRVQAFESDSDDQENVVLNSNTDKIQTAPKKKRIIESESDDD